MRPLLIVLLGQLALAGCKQAARSDITLLDPPAEAGAWARAGRDGGDSYYSPLDGIDAGNVDGLGLAFEFRDFQTRGRMHYGMQSTPVMVDGKLIFSGPWGDAYALDARSGKLLWRHDGEADGQYARNACCGVVNRGVAVADGKVFVGSLDGWLFALDIVTGKQVWKVDTFVNRKWNYTLTGAPQIAGDAVMIGNGGSDMGARGYVSAYDVNSGKLVWRFWSVPGDPAAGPDETPEVTLARKTWPKDTRWELGLGGTAWNGLAYDPASNTAYLGLGNGGPHPAWLRSRSGEVTDQLFLSSIVAVDADTGRMKWYYQQTPGDSWDFTATAPMVLATLAVDGKPRKVLMQAPKNGLFYVLDRESGKLLRADPYTRVNWTSGVDMQTGRPKMSQDANFRNGSKLVWPSGAGGHGWQPMAFSPRTGLVYIPVYEAGMEQSAAPEAKFIPGNINRSASGKFPPFSEEKLAGREQSAFEGRLKAWDPLTGKAKWTSEPLPFLNGGTMVAGDLVFAGSASGYLDAYDAASGKRVAHIFLGTVITASPMTYELDGVQYIALLAGAGGPQGAFFGPGVVAGERENYQRLIVLKLDGGKIALPEQRKEEAPPPLPAPVKASTATLKQGQALYMDRCGRRHVPGGAPAIYPDLWRMTPETVAVFGEIVGKGAMRHGGMADFSDQLSSAEIEAIRAWIVTDMIARRSGKAAKIEMPGQQTH